MSAPTDGSAGSVIPPRAARKLAPDLARGVMLLLIAMAYAGVYAGVGFGVDVSGEPARDRLAALFTTLFLDNRSFPMFAILFGYGMAWMVSRQRAKGTSDREVRRLLRRRGFFLLLFGAVHALLVFPGEILTSYGLAALVTGWLLLRSEKACWEAPIPYPAIWPRSERWTVTREAPHRTEVPSSNRSSSCRVGVARADHIVALSRIGAGFRR